MYKLIIRLKNTGTDFSYEWLASNGNDIQFGEDANNLLKLAALAQQIIVLVPTTDVLLTETKLPKLSYPRLLKAIPFALEDHIAEETNQLHFAIASQVKNQPLAVAVINKDKMFAWQLFLSNLLKSHYTKIGKIIPDALALPWQAESYHILIDQHIALVRTNRYAGFAIEKENLFSILQLVIKRAGSIKPKTIYFYNTNIEALFTKEQITTLNIPLQIAALPNGNSLFLLKNILEESQPLNLLQGNFAPQKKKLTRDHWVWVGLGIVAIWLVFLSLSYIAKYLILQHERSVLQNEIQQIYAVIYPQNKIPENPKSSMQKELTDLRANRSDSTFIRMINRITPAFVPLIQNGLLIKSLNFRNNQLILEVEAKETNQLDTLRHSVEEFGMKITMSHAERNPNGDIQTRLTIEELS